LEEFENKKAARGQMGGLKKRIPFFFIIGFSLVVLSACSAEKPYQTTDSKKSSGTAEPALIDKNSSWRGAVIGGALGETVEGSVTEISTRAAREAAKGNKPVAYQSNDGFQRVEAHPTEEGSTPKCRKIREQIYQEGKLVRDEVREVCH
jgi:hypothetical protein